MHKPHKINMGPVSLLLVALLIFIGIMLLLFIIKSIFYFLPAIVIAFVVLLITGNPVMGGIAFLAMAVVTFILKR